MGAKWPCFETSIGVLALLVAAQAGAAQAGPVRVVLQNEGVVQPELVTRTKNEVTRLFSLIDIDVAWVNEPVEDRRAVRFVKITNWEPADPKIPPTALGVTYSGEHGTKRAYVIWPRVQRLAIASAIGLDTMLAVAIAHEMGHMLLPSRSHAKRGLMRGTWDANDLRSAAAGLLGFSRESAVMIARALKSESTIAGTLAK